MNGPVKMYETRQIIRHDLRVTLPTCMYKIKNIHDNNNGGGGMQRLVDDHVSTPKQISNISHQDLDRQRQSDMSTLIDRQEKILQQLDELRQQMMTLKSNLVTTSSVVKSLPSNLCTAYKNKSLPVQISNGKTMVVNVSPSHPPYSLLLVRKAWSNSINLRVKTHIHSTVSELSESAKQLTKDLENYTVSNDLPVINLKLIWKDVGSNTELLVSQTPIIGESNILRYLARLTPDHLIYENLKNSYEIDSVLDLCYCLVRSKLKAEKANLLQNLCKRLGKTNWLCECSKMTIADLAASSAIKQVVAPNEVNPRIAKYLQLCN